VTIKTLTIESFVGIEHAELVFGRPVVLVTGANNAGKSSVRDALLWAITGLTRDISKKNDARLLAHDGGKMKVTVECDDGWKFSRTATGCTVQDGELRKRFGDPGVVRACMDAFELLDKSPRERMELVKAVGSSGEALVGAFNQGANAHIGETGLLPGAVEPILDYLAGGNIDKAEAVAVEGRRAGKRKLDEIPAEAPPAKVTIAGKEIDLSAGTQDQMRAYLKKLEGERDAVMQSQGAAKLLDMPEAIQRDIAEAKAKLAKLQRGNPGEEQKLAAEVAKLRAERDAAGQKVGEAKARYDMARKRYAEAEKLKEKCPTCAQKLTREALAGLLKSIQDEGNAAGIDKEDAEVKQVEIGARVTQVQARLDAIKTDGLAVAGLEVEIGSLRSNLAESEALDRDPEKLAALDARIEMGRQVIAAKEAYESSSFALAQRAGIEAECGHWDALAKLLGPDGAVRRAATAGFKLETVQAHAAALLDAPAAVAVSADWTITLNGRVRMSRSEKWRLGAAFAAALAESAGLDFLALDEADILAGECKGRLRRWAELLAGQFGRTLLLATADEPPPDNEWMEAWHVVGGVVARPVQVAAAAS